MNRREFITLLGGGAAAWPLTARAQQPTKLPTIGYLGATSPSAASRRIAAFVQRLRELGWVEGRTVAIEYRWAEGRSERGRNHLSVHNSDVALTREHLRNLLAAQARASYFAGEPNHKA